MSRHDAELFEPLNRLFLGLDLPARFGADQVEDLGAGRELVLLAYAVRGELDWPGDQNDSNWQALREGDDNELDARMHQGAERVAHWVDRLEAGALEPTRLLGQMLKEAAEEGNEGLNTDETNNMFRYEMANGLRELDLSELEPGEDSAAVLDAAAEVRKGAIDAAAKALDLNQAAEQQRPHWYVIEDRAEALFELDAGDERLSSAQGLRIEKPEKLLDQPGWQEWLDELPEHLEVVGVSDEGQLTDEQRERLSEHPFLRVEEEGPPGDGEQPPDGGEQPPPDGEQPPPDGEQPLYAEPLLGKAQAEDLTFADLAVHADALIFDQDVRAAYEQAGYETVPGQQTVEEFLQTQVTIFDDLLESDFEPTETGFEAFFEALLEPSTQKADLADLDATSVNAALGAQMDLINELASEDEQPLTSWDDLTAADALFDDGFLGSVFLGAPTLEGIERVFKQLDGLLDDPRAQDALFGRETWDLVLTQLKGDHELEDAGNIEELLDGLVQSSETELLSLTEDAERLIKNAEQIIGQVAPFAGSIPDFDFETDLSEAMKPFEMDWQSSLDAAQQGSFDDYEGFMAALDEQADGHLTVALVGTLFPDPSVSDLIGEFQ